MGTRREGVGITEKQQPGDRHFGGFSSQSLQNLVSRLLGWEALKTTAGRPNLENLVSRCAWLGGPENKGRETNFWRFQLTELGKSGLPFCLARRPSKQQPGDQTKVSAHKAWEIWWFQVTELWKIDNSRKKPNFPPSPPPPPPPRGGITVPTLSSLKTSNP